MKILDVSLLYSISDILKNMIFELLTWMIYVSHKKINPINHKK